MTTLVAHPARNQTPFETLISPASVAVFDERNSTCVLCLDRNKFCFQSKFNFLPDAPLVYTVINKAVNGYEVVSNRFWHGVMDEKTLRMFHDMGAAKGIRVTESGDIELIKAVQIETKAEAEGKETATKGKQ